MHHEGSQWHKKHCLSYHSYLTPEHLDLPGAIAFACGDSTASGSKHALVSLQRVLYRQEKDSDGNAVTVDGCNKRSDSEKTKPELYTFVPKARNVLEDD